MMDSATTVKAGSTLVPVVEAASILCFDVGMTGPYSPKNLDMMADTVAQVCTLYVASSSDETMRPLREDELRGGRFVEGAKRMVFDDGRPVLDNLLVMRTALHKVTGIIQRLRTGN